MHAGAQDLLATRASSGSASCARVKCVCIGLGLPRHAARIEDAAAGSKLSLTRAVSARERGARGSKTGTRRAHRLRRAISVAWPPPRRSRRARCAAPASGRASSATRRARPGRRPSRRSTPRDSTRGADRRDDGGARLGGGDRSARRRAIRLASKRRDVARPRARRRSLSPVVETRAPADQRFAARQRDRRPRARPFEAQSGRRAGRCRRQRAPPTGARRRPADARRRRPRAGCSAPRHRRDRAASSSPRSTSVRGRLGPRQHLDA